MNKNGENFSVQACAERDIIFNATYEVVENTIKCFVHDDKDAAVVVEPLYEVIKSLKEKIRKNHNMRLAKGECSVELGMALTDIVSSLDRIAGHCSNIAEEEIALDTEKYQLHLYSRITRENSEFYKEKLAEYQKKYYMIKEFE